MHGTPDTLDVQLAPSSPWVPLRFVEVGADYLVAASSWDARWPIDALRRGRVAVRLGGSIDTRRVFLVVDATERDRFRALALTRYGEAAVERWFPATARVLRLGPTSGPDTGPDYGGWLSAEFDLASETYADRIRRNPIERAARERSLRLLRATLPPGGSILELGSGPGIETLPLLDDGF